MPRIRQAIPLEEIAANMKNQPRSTKSSRYSRTPTYINEEVAEARIAVVGMTFGGVAVLALLAAIFSVSYAMDRIEAKPAPIYAKSELTQAQIKALNVMPARSEKHAKR